MGHYDDSQGGRYFIQDDGACYRDYLEVRDFANAARLLEPDDAIPASLLSDEDAEALLAYLPSALRIDKDGAFWNVTLEVPAQERPHLVELAECTCDGDELGHRCGNSAPRKAVA